MNNNWFDRRFIAEFTIGEGVVTDESRHEQHTGRIPGVTSEQWAILGRQLNANIAEVIEEAREDLKAHQGKQYGNTQWTFDFVKPRSRAIARWEIKLREEGQKAIKEMFPDVETPPVDLICAVVALGDGESFTYTIRKRGAEPGQQRGVDLIQITLDGQEESCGAGAEA